MSVASIGKGIVRAQYAERGHPRKVRGNDVTSDTSSCGRIAIRSADVEARIPAKLVPELSQPFVAQPKVDIQPLSNFDVILRKQ